MKALNVNSPQSSLVRRLSAKKRLSKSDSKSVLIATKAVCLESRGLQSDSDVITASLTNTGTIRRLNLALKYLGDIWHENNV